MIAGEYPFEFLSQRLVEQGEVVEFQAFAIGWVGDEDAVLRSLVEVFDGLALNFNHLGESGTLDVGTGNGNGLALNIVAINLVLEFAFGAVVVIDALEEFVVIVGPSLESILVAIHARIDVGGDEGGLDQEGSRAAHGVDEVALAPPAAQQDDAGGKHLVDGGIGLCLAPTTLIEGRTAGVEREGHLVVRDVHVEFDVGRVESDGGPTVVLLAEVVGNGVLHPVGNKA